MTTRCSSCKAPIVWGRSSTGRAVPLDPEEVRVIPGMFDPPPPKGAFATVCTEGGRVVRGLRADSDAGAEVLALVPEFHRGVVVGRVTHFSSCPNAAAHRGRGRPS
jgi:hypothetical protein